MHPNLVIVPSHVRRKENQVADDLANLGANWNGPDLHCNAAQDQNHPILLQCIHKDGLVDVPPDGVSERPMWQDLHDGDGRCGMGPRDGLVPQPINPPSV
jgi:hypothetical protein